MSAAALPYGGLLVLPALVTSKVPRTGSAIRCPQPHVYSLGSRNSGGRNARLQVTAAIKLEQADGEQVRCDAHRKEEHARTTSCVAAKCNGISSSQYKTALLLLAWLLLTK